MRQSQKNNRARSRGRKPSNPLSRSYDSNGPDVKIRGTASHIAEKYQSLARDAQASGDIVLAENYYQHAEHYLRIIAAAQASNRDNDNRHGNGDQPSVGRNSRRGQAPVAAEASEETSQPQAESSEAASASAEVVAFDASDPNAEQPVIADTEPVAQEDKEAEAAPAPAKPRRRRTTYRSRKKPAAADAAEAAPKPAAAPAEAPQPAASED